MPNVASGRTDSYFILPYFGQSERRGGLVGAMDPIRRQIASTDGPEGGCESHTMHQINIFKGFPRNDLAK